MSADFGDHSAEIGSGNPQGIVEQLLRNLAEQAIHSGCVFVPDNAT